MERIMVESFGVMARYEKTKEIDVLYQLYEENCLRSQHLKRLVNNLQRTIYWMKYRKNGLLKEYHEQDVLISFDKDGDLE